MPLLTLLVLTLSLEDAYSTHSYLNKLATVESGGSPVTAVLEAKVLTRESLWKRWEKSGT